ncbi:unnamed protein product [Nesidiocoris tenuis]|uniref:Uncharacterized protein n=1 Tax=Nesidiocoris tenuis TaxID=355587 RepID=A0A6H5GA47_9HEMI|nr:unnamed protein product [Nesidiocoris tenuis]
MQSAQRLKQNCENPNFLQSPYIMHKEESLLIQKRASSSSTCLRRNVRKIVQDVCLVLQFFRETKAIFVVD